MLGVISDIGVKEMDGPLIIYRKSPSINKVCVIQLAQNGYITCRLHYKASAMFNVLVPEIKSCKALIIQHASMLNGTHHKFDFNS